MIEFHKGRASDSPKTAYTFGSDALVGKFVLVLITEEFDAVGPLAISKLLFKAYNAAATPSTIDPFIVRLHGPEHRIVREMAKIMPFNFSFTPSDRAVLAARETTKIGRAITAVGGLEIDGDGFTASTSHSHLPKKLMSYAAGIGSNETSMRLQHKFNLTL